MNGNMSMSGKRITYNITSPYPGEQDKTTSHTGVKSWKDRMRNYLQPEGKLKPTQHNTSTYNRSLSQATQCMV